MHSGQPGGGQQLKKKLLLLNPLKLVGLWHPRQPYSRFDGKQCEGEAELSESSVSASAESMLCFSKKKGQSSAIDMFNKLARVTAGVIVRAALGSARHMVANRHDIAARLDLSIPSQWH